MYSRTFDERVVRGEVEDLFEGEEVGGVGDAEGDGGHAGDGEDAA